MSKTKKFFIGGGLILLILIAVYVYLGGLNTIEVSEVAVSHNYKLLGLDYTGRPASKAMRDSFETLRGFIADGKISGTLALVYFNDAKTKKGEYQMFIGILLDEIPEEYPEEYRLMGVELKRAVQANITVHNVVMPSPNTIESRMEDFARKQGLQLKPLSIELYQPDNTLRVQIPLVD